MDMKAFSDSFDKQFGVGKHAEYRAQLLSLSERAILLHAFVIEKHGGEGVSSSVVGGDLHDDLGIGAERYFGEKLSRMSQRPEFLSLFNVSGKGENVVYTPIGEPRIFIHGDQLVLEMLKGIGADGAIMKRFERRVERKNKSQKDRKTHLISPRLAGGTYIFGEYDFVQEADGEKVYGINVTYIEGLGQQVLGGVIPIKNLRKTVACEGQFVVGKSTSDGLVELLDAAHEVFLIRQWGDFNESTTSSSFGQFMEGGGTVISVGRDIARYHKLVLFDGGKLYVGFELNKIKRSLTQYYCANVKVFDQTFQDVDSLKDVFTFLGHGGVISSRSEQLHIGAPNSARWGSTDVFLTDSNIWNPLIVPMHTNRIGDATVDQLDSAKKGETVVTGEMAAGDTMKAEGAGDPDGINVPIANKDAATVRTDGNVERWNPREIDFLRGLISYVERCGFKYSTNDIVRFHTAIKCGILTVLGGDPGCGKSSLFELYSRYLRAKMLQISVNPSWVEPADVLGSEDYKGVFREARCGLAKFLRNAQSDSADYVYAVCFEEMNLACAEHYFSDFMQVISRMGERMLYGYERAGVGDSSPAPLILSDQVRIVGTCNFDETTKAFSSRFYDRCSYIELASNEIIGFPPSIPRIVPNDGDALTSSELLSWAASEGEVSPVVEKLFVSIGEILQKMSLAPSPRVAFEIKKYILSRPPAPAEECDADLQYLQKTAFDEAVAQRILSKYLPDPDPTVALVQNSLDNFLRDNKLTTSLRLKKNIDARMGIPAIS